MAARVLHIITQLELGGAQKNVLQIVSGLDRSRYEVHLVSSAGLLDEEAKKIPGLYLKFLPFLKRAPDPFSDLAAFLWLYFYIRKEKIEIVHTHSSKAGILGRWAARCAGVPVIVHTIHGWGFHDYVRNSLNDFCIFLERKTAGITTRFIAVSENDIRKGLAHGIGLEPQYVLIRCGIEPVFLKEGDDFSELRRSVGIEPGEKVVTMVACLKPQKNPVDFVKAAQLILQKNPQTKFLLAGDGALRARVQKEADRRKLGGSFLMLGWRKDVDKIMPLSDVLVLTSLWEGLPIVLLEAMRYAKPVVAYDVGGVREVVEDRVNGFLVAPKDVEALSFKIGMLLENSDLRWRMGQFGRHIVSNELFSTPYMVKQIAGLYEGLKKE